MQQEDSFKKALEMIKLLMKASTEVGSDLNLVSESTSTQTSFAIEKAEKGEEPKEIEEEMELEEMEEEAVLKRVVVEKVVSKGRGSHFQSKNYIADFGNFKLLNFEHEVDKKKSNIRV